MGEGDQEFFEPVASPRDTLALKLEQQKKAKPQSQPSASPLSAPEQILPMEDNSEEEQIVARPVIRKEKSSEPLSSEPSLESHGITRRQALKGIFWSVLGLSGIGGLVYFLWGKGLDILQGKADQISPSIKKLLEDSQFSDFLQKLKLSPENDKLSDPAQKISDGALYMKTCLEKCDQVNWETLIVYAEKGSDEDFLGQVVALQGANSQKTNYLNADKTINSNSLNIDGLNNETKTAYINAFNVRMNLLKQQGKYKEVIP